MDIASHRAARDYITALRCLAAGRGQAGAARERAAALYGPNSPVTRLVNKGSALTSDDLGSTDEEVQAARRGFLELVRQRSPSGRIPGWRRTGFETETTIQTSATTADWIGEAGYVLPTKPEFDPAKLPRRKLQSLVLTTDDVVMGSDDFTANLSRDLVTALANAEWAALFDPVSDEVAGERPASLTAGVTGIPSSGTDAAAVRTDLQALTDTYLAGGGDPEAAVLVMPSSIAVRLALMQNPLGVAELTATGGNLFGWPVFASSGIPVYSDGGPVVLFDPSRTLLADEPPDIDVVRQASIRFTTGDGAAEMVNLWQTNTAAFKASHWLNWKPAPGAVAYLADVNWGSA